MCSEATRACRHDLCLCLLTLSRQTCVCACVHLSGTAVAYYLRCADVVARAARKAAEKKKRVGIMEHTQAFVKQRRALNGVPADGIR